MPPSAIQVAFLEGIILVATMTLSSGAAFLAATAARSPAPPEPMIRISQEGSPLALPLKASFLEAFLSGFLSSQPLSVKAPTPIQAPCKNLLLDKFSFIWYPLFKLKISPKFEFIITSLYHSDKDALTLYLSETEL